MAVINSKVLMEILGITFKIFSFAPKQYQEPRNINEVKIQALRTNSYLKPAEFKILRKSAFPSNTKTVLRNLKKKKVWQIKNISQSKNESFKSYWNFSETGEVINNSQAT